MAADRKVPHHPEELAKLLQLASQARSILEIGSRYGEVLKLMAQRSRERGGAKIVAVDLPNVFPWGEDSEQTLRGNVESLKKSGFDVHLFIADSTDPDTVAAVHDLGPFDLVFIDGDHRYEGVRLDWLNYGPLGKVVVFHDIVKPRPNERQELGVWKLWQEIEGNKEEYVGAGSNMGLGIVRH